MPDQRGLLVWSNGVERLAIETRIVGEGTIRCVPCLATSR